MLLIAMVSSGIIVSRTNLKAQADGWKKLAELRNEELEGALKRIKSVDEQLRTLTMQNAALIRINMELQFSNAELRVKLGLPSRDIAAEIRAQIGLITAPEESPQEKGG